MNIPPPFNLPKDINFFTNLKYELVRPSQKITYIVAFFLQLLRILFDSFFKIGSKDYVFIWDIRNNAITFDLIWVIFYVFCKFRKPINGFTGSNKAK